MELRGIAVGLECVRVAGRARGGAAVLRCWTVCSLLRGREVQGYRVNKNTFGEASGGVCVLKFVPEDRPNAIHAATVGEGYRGVSIIRKCLPSDH